MTALTSTSRKSPFSRCKFCNGIQTKIVEMKTGPLLWLGLVFLANSVLAQFTLRVRSNPAGCVGGEVCIFQPSVAVYNFFGQVAVTYQGSASVVLQASPSGFEKLYSRECDYSGCGTAVAGSSASAPFVNGIAQFNNLTLATAGSGYSMSFTGRDTAGIAFASVASAFFSVAVGPVYKSQFSVFVGHTLGGQLISPQPAVSLADRGGNVVTTISGYTVTASLMGPSTALLPTMELTTVYKNGIAQFNGLYINKAGNNYIMVFKTNLGSAIDIPTLYSSTFQVGVGVPASLEFVEGHGIGDNDYVYGGEFLKVAPRLRIMDAGGNLVSTDSLSGVKVTIRNNPSGGQILPASSQFQVAKQGIISFPSLRVTAIGSGYVLVFTLYSFDGLTNSYTMTSTEVLTPVFEVLPGLPRSLVVTSQAGQAYSGGQAFKTQPVIAIQDYGGNTVDTDYESVVRASLIPSLHASVDIRLQADQPVSVYITGVSTTTPSGTYGAGEHIYFDVSFLYEVWLTLSSGNRPFLVMNTAAPDGNARSAFLVGNYQRTMTLRFRYIVHPLDSTSALDFTYLNLNGSTIVDGNGNTPSTSLPSSTISSTKTIVIDTTAPLATAFNTTTPSGIYGAGQDIDFFVTFSEPVTVSGTPWLVLNTPWTSGGVPLVVRALFSNITNGTAINATTLQKQVVHHNVSYYANKTIYFAYAAYDRMEGSDTVVFRYVVRPGDTIDALAVGADIYLNTTDDWIRRTSSSPTQAANYSLAPLLPAFRNSSVIQIDTSSPILNATYGVQTSHADGVYYAGEVIYVTMQFNIEVAINGIDIALYMECGTPLESAPCTAVFSRLYPDHKTIEFEFTVPTLINTTRLDILATGGALLIPFYPYYIRRKSTNPTTPVNPNTTQVTLFGHSLAHRSRISLYSFVPVVTSVDLVSLNISSNVSKDTLYPGDFAMFSVKFSTKVATTCRPVVVIIADLAREAVYVSGNETDTLIFQYTVELGDNADSLAYRFQPNALCYESGCPAAIATSCSINAFSTRSDFPADVFLPIGTGDRFTGIIIDPNVTIIGTPIGRNTTIKHIRINNADGIYGAGTILSFTLTFTDDVIYSSLDGVGTPKLHLSVGHFAVYSGGSGTKEFTFYYIIQQTDVDAQLLLTANGTSVNVFSCDISANCIIKNRNGQVVSQYSPPSIVASSNIFVKTDVPQIIGVWTDKPTSPYFGRYTTGELIQITVQYNEPVVIIGVEPRMEMNTSNAAGNQYAFYDPDQGNSTHLVFRYLVVQGDSSPDLMYFTRQLDLSSGQSAIYRVGDLPTTEANYTLPDLSTLSRSGQIIRIETATPPKVLRVYALSNNVTYRTGDTFELRVQFSQYVTCSGRPTLMLNMGNHYGTALFLDPVQAVGNQANTSGYPTEPATVLVFNYTVQATDFSFHLDYVDEFSLDPGITPLGGPGVIYASSTFPTLSADLDLPIPGKEGSLGAESEVYVDGRVTYETALEFLNDPGTYGVGSEILIRMNFSTDVVVEGQPYLLMDTGTSFHRPAYYLSGNGSSSLIFLLVPQPGDFSANLDYAVDAANLSTAYGSFQLNGHIFTRAMHPVLPVAVYLNPTGGVLSGTLSETAAIGITSFRDLTIDVFGPDYLLQFSSAAIGAHATIVTSHLLFVSFSSQFELVPDEGLPGDAAGWSVAVSGDLVAVGAPNSNISVTTIQTVTTTGIFSAPVPEVDTITTYITPQPAIQSFYTSAAVGQTVGGYFTITYGSSGTSRPLPANLNADMLKVFLSEDFADLGSLSVAVEPYLYCACFGAFKWTVTFNDITKGKVSHFSFDGSMLTGTGAEVVGPIIVQEPALLGGGFTLSARGLTSRMLSVTATPTDLQLALADLDLSFLSVTITPTDASLARSWIVTFDAFSDAYTIPELTVNSHITGGDGGVSVQVTRPGVHGPSGIGGYFQLTFRDNTTVPLLCNASALDVKLALEALPVINTVNVNRSLPNSINGFTWTIEFLLVSHNTPRGYVEDPIGNVEPLGFVNHLIGSNVTIDVGAVWGMGSNKSINFFDTFREGTYGAKAGAVYIFQRTTQDYVEVAFIHGNDTDVNDQFGYSVAMQGDLLLVGAVSADKNGVLEKQAIFCSATSGYFVLAFRGWTSSPISFNATVLELTNAIIDTGLEFGNLYNIRNILIDDWGSGGLCANNTAVITFFSPVDGAPNLFDGEDTGANLELMTIHNTTLGNTNRNDSVGVVQVIEVQNGTIRVHGTGADPQQVGSAYIFRAVYSCASNVTICYKRNWVQEAQFFPTKNLDQPTRFGFSVAINGTVAVVGAPGDGSGAVYVYEYDSTTGLWGLLQRITVAELSDGDSLGYSLALYGNTILLGAPYYLNGTGMVKVYQRPAGGGVFSDAQELIPSPVSYPLRMGDLFGISVGISGNVAIVGSAGRAASAIYTGTEASAEAPVQTGIVYVFTRAAVIYNFFFHDVLTPTNVKNFDRFGWSVALDGEMIVASSMQEYTGPLLANRVIMEVKTSAEYVATDRLGGFFNLEWVYTNATTGRWRTARTRSIRYDISAAELAVILEKDLGTGDVIVTRSRRDEYDKGYAWTVTFMAQTTSIPPLVGDPTNLNGINASVTVTVLNPYPSHIRGVTHVFQQSTTLGDFVEQAFLCPMLQENMDLCGWQVALDGDVAAVGCPNRDGIVPNTNSGSAEVYSLTLLHVAFSDSELKVPEGETASLGITRTSSNVEDVDVLFYVTTVDRNSDASVQSYLQFLFGLETSAIAYPLTVCDVVGVSGLAVARSQFYGSTHNESLWVDGMYDYRGISDYVPINTPRAYLTTSTTISQNITTTGDIVLEKPDEHFVVSLNSPGLWPSMLGSLQMEVLIENNGDGKAAGFAYDKIYESASFAASGNGFGGAVAIHEAMGAMFASTPLGDYVTTNSFGVASTVSDVGYVVQYSLFNGSWIEVSRFFSPNMCEGCQFGTELKLSQIQNRSESILVVGEPFNNTVHVYYSSPAHFGVTWVHEAKLTRPEAYLPTHQFGDHGAIAVSNDVVVIGAAGLEAIFVFYRLYSSSSESWYWTSGELLRSSDFDYDLIDGLAVMHRQRFGKSVAVSSRTIAAGAPYADYGKLGSNLVEVNWDTEGTDIFGYGRGKAYVFSSSGAVQQISLTAEATLSEGTFRLNFTYAGITETTVEIPYSASNVTVAEAVDGLYYLDNVVVSVSVVTTSLMQTTTWFVTFVDAFDEVPLLEPLWHGYGCPECAPFSSNATDNTEQVEVTAVSAQTSFTQVANVSAYDKTNGMRFGWSTALDGNQLLVGAIYSPSVTSTSWDFEAGTLLGWTSTGTAFEYQPTFGDNSYVRAVYPANASLVGANVGLPNRGERSGMIGRYYIGTFEKRPGDASDWRVPSPDFPQGNYQGDGPVGTLTSDVFMLRGSTISFLVGGGCDYYAEYVELIVDGISVQKQTGDCTERMQLKTFDVSNYLNRAAQIRIVDASQSKWGHINVDNFQFDWDVSGARLTSANNRVTAGGVVEAPRSGAVYGFLRHRTDSLDICYSDTTVCEWSAEVKLTPSDKRPEMMFGSSIVLDDSLGLAVIGAPGAQCMGFYKEVQSVYPYQSDNGDSNAAGVNFPVDVQLYMATMESVPLFVPEASGANGVWQAHTDAGSYPNILASFDCGAAYLFVRTPASIGPLGNVVVQQQWTNTENARFQPSDGWAGDTFAKTLDLSSGVLAAGAVGQDGYVDNGGAVYAYNMGFAALSFSQAEFRVLQGTDSFATITVLRNTEIFDGEMEIAYATSDLTAKGVDGYKYAACLLLSPANRGPAGCGDYEQTQGKIYYPEGANSGGFTVNIVNYLCSKPFLKFIQLTLSVPGAGGIQGQSFTAKLRIDDDNFLYQQCSVLYP